MREERSMQVRKMSVWVLWLFSSLCAAMPAWSGTNAWSAIAPSNITPSLIAVDPTNASVLYVATFDSSTSVTTVTKSSDGGATWSAPLLASGLGDIVGLVAAPSAPGTVFAVFSDTQGGGASFFRSTDAGASWQLRNLGLLKPVGTFAIDPTNASVAFAQTADGVFKTTDGGGVVGQCESFVAYGVCDRPLGTEPRLRRFPRWRVEKR
jgi:hypothetical protein